MNKSAKTTSLVLILSLFIDALLLDQISKILLDANLPSPLYLAGKFISLRVEHNTGIAFSINLSYPLLIFLNVVFFGAIIFYLAKTLDLKRNTSRLILALLASGALGNLIDRVRLGYVIDFISIGNYPIFNFADAFITIAIFLLLLFYDKIKRPN